MPSFFSKVSRSLTGKKKDAQPSSPTATAPKQRTSLVSLLDGQKFEAVEKPDSPSAAKFADNAQEKFLAGKNKDVLGKTKDTPHLSLHLPDIKEDARPDALLEDVFQASGDSRQLLDWKTISTKSLNVTEALALIEPCVKSIKSRGLETLGIMHPHWYASSIADQQKLLSYFFHSLADSKNTPYFETELQYCRSPHDPAAVLRWGLRHLRSDYKPFGSTNGKSEGEWEWYKTFANAERADSFPTNAYSKALTPLLPESNAKLLNCIMDLTTALASQSELNGISGSKMCKLIGYWLLSTRQVTSQEWHAFYSDWDAAGRVLEHLFLAYLRDEQVHPKMPMRLLELIHAYPYSKDGDGMFITKPRFSTRTYPALLVRVDIKTEKGHNKSTKTARQLVEDALSADINSVSMEKDDEYWTWFKDLQHTVTDRDKTAALNGDAEYPTSPDPTHPPRPLEISRIFDDETLQLFELQTRGEGEEPVSPTISIISTSLPSFRRTPARRRSLSVNDAPIIDNVSTSTTTTSKPTPKVPASTASPISTGQGTDWVSFSTTGFLDTESAVGFNFASTLFDKDTEITNPATTTISRKSSLKRKLARGGSIDLESNSPTIPVKESQDIAEAITIASCSQTTVDEAFIDFWSDAIADSVTQSWPTFALCQLKSSAAIKRNGETITWIVIEAQYSAREPSPNAVQSIPAAAAKIERTTSTSSRQTSATTKSKKLFGFFSSSISAKSAGTVKKSPSRGGKIGEMGEIVQEDSPTSGAEKEERKEESESRSKEASALSATATGVAGVATLAQEKKLEEKPELVHANSTKSAPLPVLKEVAPSPVDEAPVPVTNGVVSSESNGTSGVASIDQTTGVTPVLPQHTVDESSVATEHATPPSEFDALGQVKVPADVQLPEASRSRASIVSSGSKFVEHDLTPDNSGDESFTAPPPHGQVLEQPRTEEGAHLTLPATTTDSTDLTPPAQTEKTPVQAAHELPGKLSLAEEFVNPQPLEKDAKHPSTESEAAPHDPELVMITEPISNVLAEKPHPAVEETQDINTQPHRVESQAENTEMSPNAVNDVAPAVHPQIHNEPIPKPPLPELVPTAAAQHGMEAELHDVEPSQSISDAVPEEIANNVVLSGVDEPQVPHKLVYEPPVTATVPTGELHGEQLDEPAVERSSHRFTDDAPTMLTDDAPTVANVDDKPSHFEPIQEHIAPEAPLGVDHHEPLQIASTDPVSQGVQVLGSTIAPSGANNDEEVGETVDHVEAAGVTPLESQSDPIAPTNADEPNNTAFTPEVLATEPTEESKSERAETQITTENSAINNFAQEPISREGISVQAEHVESPSAFSNLEVEKPPQALSERDRALSIVDEVPPNVEDLGVSNTGVPLEHSEAKASSVLMGVHENGVVRKDDPPLTSEDTHAPTETVHDEVADATLGRHDSTGIQLPQGVSNHEEDMAQSPELPAKLKDSPVTDEDNSGGVGLTQEAAAGSQSTITQLLSTLQTTAQDAVQGLGNVVDTVLPNAPVQDQQSTEHAGETLPATDTSSS